MDIKEEKFQIRAYGFGELAQMYLPDIKPKSASVRLSNWIKFNNSLQTELEKNGYKKGSRILTPQIVEIIAKHLGAPC